MNDNTDRLSTSTSTPLTYEAFNQQSQDHLKGFLAPFDAKSSTFGLGGFGVGANPLQSSSNKLEYSNHGEGRSSAAAAAAADRSSLGSAIASTTTVASLNNASLSSPSAFLNASPLPTSEPQNDFAVVKPLNGTNSAIHSYHNHLAHGGGLSGASTEGHKNLDASERLAQQNAISPESLMTTGAAPSLSSASGTAASDQALSANGTYRPDVSSSNSPAVINKPVLKMKRTGQNFPLSSGTGSLYQRNRSYSPNQRRDPLQARGGATGKASETVQRGGQEPPRNVIAGLLGARSSEKLGGPSETEPHQGLHSLGDSAPNDALRETAKPATIEHTNGKTSAVLHDSDTDDIIYETAAHAGAVDGAVEDVIDNESSSDDSDTESEDVDGTAGMDADEASLRQLFRAPDQENDYNDSEGNSEDDEEEEDDDDMTSESSSDDSSIVEEPVALPSADIQHQESYPSTILEMAEPGRLYTEFIHGGVTIKAGPALFPVGYSKSNINGLPWICAVRSCRLVYKTSAGLANHARFTHKKAMFNDNMDGTVSLVGSYSKKNESGHYPPVIVSKRPLNPKEPPMREPTIPTNKLISSKVRSDVKTTPAGAVLDGHNLVMAEGDADRLEQEENPITLPVADSKSSEQTWEYIRPFLSKHKSIPERNWARHVIHLPRVRDVRWNEARIKEWPYKDSHARDVTALLVHITGVESPTPCHHCVQGRGPFIGCVVISPKASDEVKRAVLSCANCYYHCGQSSCSICKNAVARRERRARAGQKPSSYNVKLLSDVARQKTAEAKMDQAKVFSGSRTSPQAPVLRSMKLYLPSEIKSIEKASSERSYKVIKGLDGKDVLMCGALIPEQYDLDRTVPGYPWICPVRSCRRVFKKIASLGAHFIRQHHGSLLNDNQDGTLSQIGYYDEPLPGNNSLQPLVVSTNPLDPNEPPMETPGLPGVYVPRILKHKVVIKKPDGPAQNLSTHPRASISKELWNYMRPYLPESIDSIPSHDPVFHLLDLPRQREVQWRVNMHNVKVTDDMKQILGLIVYLTGEEHKNGEKSCTHCIRRNGPFPSCMTLTNGVPEDAKSMVQACANCIFTHKSSACSIKSGWARYASERSPSEATAKKRVLSTDDESEEPAATRRRSDRLGHADREDRSGQRRKIVKLSLKRNDSNNQTSGLGVVAHLPVQMGTASDGGAIKNEPSSALIHAGQVQPEELLEMEDWEIAPGRIRGAGADGINNSIAFSKSYLEANQTVRVSRDVTFEVKSIKSGNNLELKADQANTRYCTLASGKLYVKVEEQEPFTIGPHGLFKIAPGSAAKIQNRLYIDSVLHISTYSDG